MIRLRRPYLLPTGGMKSIHVHVCTCKLVPDNDKDRDFRRGPSGGCCGSCGGGIPSAYEARCLSWSANNSTKEV